MPLLPSLRRPVFTLGLSLAGVGAWHLTGLPLPFLFGPMFACLIAALLGADLGGVKTVSTGMRTVLGVAVGASLTPAVVGQMGTMLLSLALVPLFVLLIGLVGVPFFRRVCGYDPVTAWYAAMPGGLADMVIFGTEAGGNPRTLSLIHATRVLILVSVAPIVLVQLFGAALDQPIGAPAAELPVSEMLLMLAAALIGWKGGERIGLFGASILGPLILAGALSLGGFLTQRPPAEAILAAQFFIGMGLGVGYVGVTVAELRRDVAAGVAFVLILAALAAAITELVVLAGLAGPVEAFLAFAPGGQAEMTVLAIIAGADLGYVVVHHLTRIMVVIAGAPLAARLIRGRPK